MAGIGETLRLTREHRGLSIEQVAQDTRISVRFLEALEAEQFDELPAPVYVRGFLRSYANYLKIDAQPLLDSLVGGERIPAGGPDGFVRGPQAPSQRN
ncbi:MAG: helix-turn-helix domain-containing protein, partial [Chloroflexi bacterium]|nr:helix-turn-helix domain-containing protein [Chloroflexota bacterium]